VAFAARIMSLGSRSSTVFAGLFFALRAGAAVMRISL
jgi:hypothetical protein